MFTTVSQFISAWKNEMQATVKILDALTDESLALPKHPDVRNLGRVAWHIVTTIPEMLEKLGFEVGGPTEKDPIPLTAGEIRAAYIKHGEAVLRQISQWQDAEMFTEDEMYGETWARGLTLWILVKHEIHHRAQMTILMRLAGLMVPGIYGPSREEWPKYGMPVPEL